LDWAELGRSDSFPKPRSDSQPSVFFMGNTGKAPPLRGVGYIQKQRAGETKT